MDDMESASPFPGPITSSDAVVPSELSDEVPAMKEDRVIRKAKRTLKPVDVKFNEASLHGTEPAKPVGAFSKNSRKSRNTLSHSRGEPKKGGAGGKGVWGKPGSELDEPLTCRDVHDPNYDSDSQEEYKLEEVEPALTDEQLDSAVEPIIREYLEHGKSEEFEELLKGLNLGSNKHRVAKLALTIALDRHNSQRELVSRLISDLYSKVLTREHIEQGFQELLQSLDDIVLDTPDAHILVGQFIARCVADDCLAPKFITTYKNSADNEWVKGALEKAEVLLSMKNGIAHLDNIWGMGGGNRSVKNLTIKVTDLLKEYISSGDENEAMRCLLELDVPHFHHELVYQSCDMAIEDSTDRVISQMVQLLKFLTTTNVLVIDQFEKGMRRLFNDIQDICLDVPAAYSLLEQLIEKLRGVGLVSDALMGQVPSKGRKRFVSEGDGGLLK